jgi:hypothetical protein
MTTLIPHSVLAQRLHVFPTYTLDVLRKIHGPVIHRKDVADPDTPGLLHGCLHALIFERDLSAADAENLSNSFAKGRSWWRS